MCKCICMYIYTYVQTYIHMYIHTTNTFLRCKCRHFMRLRSLLFTCVGCCISKLFIRRYVSRSSIWPSLPMSVRAHAHRCAYVCMYINVCMNLHMHGCTHIHVCMCDYSTLKFINRRTCVCFCTNRVGHCFSFSSISYVSYVCMFVSLCVCILILTLSQALLRPDKIFSFHFPHFHFIFNNPFLCVYFSQKF